MNNGECIVVGATAQSQVWIGSAKDGKCLRDVELADIPCLPQDREICTLPLVNRAIIYVLL
jgi:hypothetical protein